MMINTQKKILSIPLAFAFIGLTIGTVFKVQHWPFGFELKLICVFAIGIFYTFRHVVKTSKTIKDFSKIGMVLSWTILTVFVLLKIPYLMYPRILLEITGCSWLIIEIGDIIQEKPKLERANTIQLIGMLILAAHFVFAIQQWPFAGPMLVLSLFAYVLIAIGFIIKSRSLI
ncbi:MAG: hypothetical protein MK066_10560 [Crocinitomicaceae bacterium]|nr:hypothetical protein [Crocinitomicaceae bacterium]